MGNYTEPSKIKQNRYKCGQAGRLARQARLRGASVKKTGQVYIKKLAGVHVLTSARPVGIPLGSLTDSYKDAVLGCCYPISELTTTSDRKPGKVDIKKLASQI